MISIVIPAYNEEHAIGRSIDDVRKVSAGAGLECEIVVVDDGSSDGTAKAAADRGVTVIRHPHNLGYGRALKSGINAARHDTIAIIDADGTYPVTELPRLLEIYARGFDMVVGARSKAVLKDSMFKSGLRRILTFLVEFTAGRQIPDINSGLRVFDKRTIQPYFPQLCDTFSFTTSMTLAYMMTSRFVTYTPIGYGARVGETKVRLFRDALRTLQYIIQSIVYFNPTKIFLLLSAGCLALALVCAAASLAISTSTAAIVGFIGIVGSLGLFGLGLVADLLRQIMRK
jgi:glycosyltransferase involved in cell wall biosynthesis